MSTSMPLPVRKTGVDDLEGHESDVDDGSYVDDGSHVLLAGSPRPARRRRALLMLVASLAVLALLGLQVHRYLGDPTPIVAITADALPAENPAPVIENAKPSLKKPATEKARPSIDKPATRSANPSTGKPATNGANPAKPPQASVIDTALGHAFDRARDRAIAAGLDLRINSGLRSATRQQQLFDEAIAKYGSLKEARHWVLPPAESAHVRGQAIDVGPREAARWLERNGVGQGLCRRYLNEWWHFELLAPAAGQQCPAMEPYAGG